MSKYTVNYTFFDLTEEKLASPRHKKREFLSDKDLLGSLDSIGAEIIDELNGTFGSNTDVEVMIRSITMDNAQEYYMRLKGVHDNAEPAL